MVQEIINEQISVESSHPQLTAVNLGGIHVGGKSGLEAVLSPLASERTVGVSCSHETKIHQKL